MINVVSRPFDRPERAPDQFWSRKSVLAPSATTAKPSETTDVAAETSTAKKAKVYFFKLPARSADPEDFYEVTRSVYTNSSNRAKPIKQEGTMKGFFDYDLHDLAVMIGAAFFFSSVVGVCWSLLSALPSPSSLGITASIVGLAIGKLVSMKSRKAR